MFAYTTIAPYLVSRSGPFFLFPSFPGLQLVTASLSPPVRRIIQTDGYVRRRRVCVGLDCWELVILGCWVKECGICHL